MRELLADLTVDKHPVRFELRDKGCGRVRLMIGAILNKDGDWHLLADTVIDRTESAAIKLWLDRYRGKFESE